MNQAPNRSATQAHHAVHYHNRRELAAISLGALGVVYGDIGTSPLYALKECLAFGSPHAVTPSVVNVLGVLSLVFWALTLVICFKYLVFVLRADNKGEGGILALSALVNQSDGPGIALKLSIPVLMALFGAGLLYGDGAITPAISVLSAMEGLSEKSPSLSYLVVPVTVAILLGLFLVQRHGTGRIGRVFGWVMLAWFVAIGCAGVPQILRTPDVLMAVNPWYGIEFFLHNGVHGFLLLGSVVLAITGGEALYADMGHFGRTPIRLAWSTVAFPALLLNYFGQGALFIGHPGERITNPFYELVEGPMLVPMLVLATMAAVIASQAMISGAFSLTRQAVQLGYFPRVTIVHTSEKQEGQIYIPEVNWALMLASVTLALVYRSSSSLASAYGIAVTGTMTITSCLFYLLCRRNWRFSRARALAITAPFFIIDLAFLSANAVKIHHGGWVPLAIGVAVFAIMTTWWRGRLELSRVMDAGTMPEDLFLMDVAGGALPRVRGTSVFMASTSDGIPNVLLHHVKHNQVLHKQVVLLSVVTENVPWVAGSRSLSVKDLDNGFFRVVARVGFMQTPDVPRLLARCVPLGLTAEPATTTYYMGRQTLITTGHVRMARWRKMLFSFLSRNARAPTSFFNLPPNRVVELGLQIEL